MSIGPNILLSQTFVITENSVSDNASVSARDFQNIALSVVGSDTAVFSVRVRGSLQDLPPDFTSPSIVGNEWDYIQLKNDKTNAYYNGDVGYVFAADGTVQLELNVSGLTWVAVEVFSYTSGTATVRFMFKDNQ